ncbi:MAG: hypothetical protein V3S49_02990, partial [Thermodesulfobacteriota bacterium]
MPHSQKKRNQEFYISARETADKLRTLANELERGIISIDGEEFYKTYLKQLEVFYQAFKTSDLKAMNSA